MSYDKPQLGVFGLQIFADMFFRRRPVPKPMSDVPDIAKRIALLIQLYVSGRFMRNLEVHSQKNSRISTNRRQMRSLLISDIVLTT